MGDVTTHFSRHEFDCKDGTVYPYEWLEKRLIPLCYALEKIRALTNQPLKVNSGFRTAAYNAKLEGSAVKSQHVQGRAADIKLGGMTSRQLYTAICNLIKQGEIPEGGIGLYRTFVHYDIRGTKARWSGI